MNINIDVRDNNIKHLAGGEKDSLATFQAAKAKVLAKDVVDPEEVVLLKILEKILNKHRVTGKAKKRSYIPFVPRQWESIEDKLRADAAEAEIETVVPGRDFIKEIKQQIAQVISTGRRASTLTRKDVNERATRRKMRQANIAIKLQQLKTSMPGIDNPAA